MFWVCLGMFWNVIEHFAMFWDVFNVLENFGMFLDVVGSFGAFSDFLLFYLSTFQLSKFSLSTVIL